MGLRIGKPVRIVKQIEYVTDSGDTERSELAFLVLPPTKSMGKQLAAVREDEKALEEALENVFSPENLAELGLIKGWEGLEDEDGNPLPCTKENIIAVCEAYPSVHALLVEALYEAVPKKAAELEKN